MEGDNAGMKNSKRCPKCESLDILILGGIGPAAHLQGDPQPPLARKTTTRRTADVWVCTECGYAESYFEAEKIDWSKAVAIRLVNPKPPVEGPYR